MKRHHRNISSEAAGDQSALFVRRMQAEGMIPLVVLGFKAVDHGLSVGSLWGERLEQSASDHERAELERLLTELSALLVGWIDHDRARLD